MARWFIRRTVLAFIVVLIVWLIYRMATIRPLEPKRVFADLPRPTVFAHQGGAGLWPSNTLFAFQQAWKLGVDVLELDVHMTRDGHIVVIHDETVDRTTDGSGAVRDMTLAEIKALDAGYWFTPDGGKTYPYRGKGIRIPTLEEVFDALPDAKFNIEVKPNDPAIVPILADLIERKGMKDQVIVGSFHHNIVVALRERLPGVATFASRNEVQAFWFFQKVGVSRAWRPIPDTLEVPTRYTLAGVEVAVVTPGFVRAAHNLGVRVDVWTINDPDEMARLLDMGVDGIITDYPDRLLELLRARGLR